MPFLCRWFGHSWLIIVRELRDGYRVEVDRICDRCGASMMSLAYPEGD